MKKITLFALILVSTFYKAQQGLQGVIVEKYYQSTAADSANAANNSAATILHKGSVTYRIFIDMAPGYKFNSFFGNQDAGGTPLHPLIFKTTTDFYNDPNYGQIYPQGTSTVNIKKNTTMIDTWLSVGGVCFGKMGVLKSEDPDGSVGNSTGILTNTLGGIFGAAINSVVPGAEDGMMPGQPVTPNALGTGTATDIFDQTAGGTFSITNGVIAALGGVVGTTTTNAILIGQFTTNGIFSFSLNVQLQNTVTGVSEVYVSVVNPNATGTEFTYTALGYSSGPSTSTTTIDSTDVGIRSFNNELSNLSVYPNPSKGNFTFSAVNVKESSNNFYSIYDITGRQILARPFGRVSGKFSETVDISNFIEGLYFLNVSLDGIVTTRKIVKE